MRITKKSRYKQIRFQITLYNYIELKLSKNFDQTKIIKLCKTPIPIVFRVNLDLRAG